MPTTAARSASRTRTTGAALLAALTLTATACSGAAGRGGVPSEEEPRVGTEAGRPTDERTSRVATQATARAAADAFGDDGTVSVALAPVRSGTAPGPTCDSAEVPVARAGEAGPFATASLVKMYVIAELLHRDRQGELQLSDDDRALMEAMVVESDDAAMSEV